MELGYQEHGVRLYDPEVGRWLQPEPLRALYPEVSPYTYGLGNPLFYVDLDGSRVRWFSFGFGIGQASAASAALGLTVHLAMAAAIANPVGASVTLAFVATSALTASSITGSSMNIGFGLGAAVAATQGHAARDFPLTWGPLAEVASRLDDRFFPEDGADDHYEPGGRRAGPPSNIIDGIVSPQGRSGGSGGIGQPAYGGPEEATVKAPGRMRFGCVWKEEVSSFGEYGIRIEGWYECGLY